MKMNPLCLSAMVCLLSVGFSADALADSRYYEVIGEGIGRTRDEAYEAASYYASQRCYLNWGQSTREQTILVEEVQPDTGYWYVKLSEGCLAED